MSPRQRRRQIDVASQVSRSAAVVGGLVGFVLEVTANQLSELGKWVPWAVMATGTVVSLVLWAVKNWWSPPVPVARRERLPAAKPLIGREETISEIVERVRKHRCVVVHGPTGIGSSSVAINAAWRLVAGIDRQYYVDVGGVGQRDVRFVQALVLRAFGRSAPKSSGRAAELVAMALRDDRDEESRRRVLLIDNVTAQRQVDWVARAVPGAYIIIAGNRTIEGLTEVKIPRLAPGDARRLLADQDVPLRPGRRLGRGSLGSLARAWWRGGFASIEDVWRRRSRGSVAERMAAEAGAAAALAEDYLLHPQVVIALGSWLARNPEVKISGLLNALRTDSQIVELSRILQQQLDGTSSGAYRLLALMKHIPEAEYGDGALAALAGTSAERAAEYLAELAGRFFVIRSPRGSHVAPQTRPLTVKVRPRTVARARRRLLAYYAEVASENVELLASERYTEAKDWFSAEDVTLQRIAEMQDPPRRGVASLSRIADALDSWYWRQDRPAERKALAEAMAAQATGAAEAVAYLRLAALARGEGDHNRAGDYLHRAQGLRHGGGAPQWYTESALQNLAKDDLDAARRDIIESNAARPPRDHAGKVNDWINLAIVDIRLGDLDHAYHYLIEASDLAEAEGDVDGQAHARELLGVVLAVQNSVAAANHEWDEADELYARIGNALGQARCDHHRELGGDPPLLL